MPPYTDDAYVFEMLSDLKEVQITLIEFWHLNSLKVSQNAKFSRIFFSRKLKENKNSTKFSIFDVNFNTANMT